MYIRMRIGHIAASTPFIGVANGINENHLGRNLYSQSILSDYSVFLRITKYEQLFRILIVLTLGHLSLALRGPHREPFQGVLNLADQ